MSLQHPFVPCGALIWLDEKCISNTYCMKEKDHQGKCELPAKEFKDNSELERRTKEFREGHTSCLNKGESNVTWLPSRTDTRCAACVLLDEWLKMYNEMKKHLETL